MMATLAIKPGWSSKPLGCVARIIGGATPRTDVSAYWDGDIRWATPKDLSQLDDKILTEPARRITEEGLANCSAEILPAGSVLFSSRAPIGLTAIAGVPMATNQGFKSFIPNPEELDPGYLYHWLRANRAALEGLGNGATFKEVSKAIVARVEIPLPPLLDDQQRIAAILDKADGIRRKRQQAIRLADTFLRSVFLDLFGDPVTNPKGWPEVQLVELGKISTGTTPPSKLEDMFGGDIPFITPADLKETWVLPSRTVTEAGASESRVVRKGATLVCCIGATIGKTGKAARRSAFNQQINAVEWNDRIDDQFGLEVLRFLKTQIAQRGTSTTLPILNKSAFQSLSIPVPPLAKQIEFAKAITALEQLKSRCLASIELAELNFSALQQRAFRGEL